jgi:nucleoid-associated protein YejK
MSYLPYCIGFTFTNEVSKKLLRLIWRYNENGQVMFTDFDYISYLEYLFEQVKQYSIMAEELWNSFIMLCHNNEQTSDICLDAHDCSMKLALMIDKLDEERRNIRKIVTNYCKDDFTAGRKIEELEYCIHNARKHIGNTSFLSMNTYCTLEQM